MYPVSHMLWGGDPLFHHNLLSLDLFLSWASLTPRAHSQQLKTAKVPFGCCHRCEDSRLKSCAHCAFSGFALSWLLSSTQCGSVPWQGLSYCLTLSCELQASCPTCCWVSLLPLLPISLKDAGTTDVPCWVLPFYMGSGDQTQVIGLGWQVLSHPSYHLTVCSSVYDLCRTVVSL